MAKLKLIQTGADSPGAAGSPAKTNAYKSKKIPKKNIRFQGTWEQPIQLRLDKTLALAVPQWIARIHTDFAAFGGLPFVEGESLWFNAWSVANLLEWTDTVAFGELEPLRLRKLVVEAMEVRLGKMRSANKKAELARKIKELARVRVGRYAGEKHVSRAKTVRQQIERGIELA